MEQILKHFRFGLYPKKASTQAHMVFLIIGAIILGSQKGEKI